MNIVDNQSPTIVICFSSETNCHFQPEIDIDFTLAFKTRRYFFGLILE